VDSGQTSENESFLYKTQHSVIVAPEERALDLILFPISTLSARIASHFLNPILATKKKNGLHFLTRASFAEAPTKTESNGFHTFISHL